MAVLDPDPGLQSVARAVFERALAREGITPGPGPSLTVTVTAPPNMAPADALRTDPDGASALDARAEVTVQARLLGPNGPWRCVCEASGEAPYGPGALAAAQAGHLARRLALEDAARCLAEALRGPLQGHPDPDGNCARE